MATDYTNYEHKPGTGKTLVSDPNTGQPVEVDIDQKTGLPKMPEVKPTYKPTQAEIDAAAKKTQPTSGIPGVPAPNQVQPNPTSVAPQTGTNTAGPVPPAQPK